MSFADDAIGFFLQLDDQLTPALQAAEGSYKKFIKSLDQFNQRAFKSVNKGMMAMASLVESFEAMPKTASRTYEATRKALQRRMKPLQQRVNIVLTPASVKNLAREVGKAISGVLAKVRLRSSATRPLKKSAFFKTTGSLTREYKQTLQPPDLLGKFQGLPRFAKGGTVPGGGGDIDSILSWLTPGEVVLPKDMVDALKDAKGHFTALPPGLRETLADISNLKTAMEKLKGAMALGVDVQDEYADATAVLNAKMVDLDGIVSHLSQPVLKQVLPQLKDAKDGFDDMGDAAEDAQSPIKTLLTKILGPARFLAINKALTDVGEGFSSLSQSAGSALEQGEELISGFSDNMNEANRSLGWTRDSLVKMKGDLMAIGSDINLVPEIMGQAFSALVDSGVRSEGQLKSLTKVVALFAEGTTADVGEAANMAYKLADSYGWGENRVAAFYATLKRVSGEANIDMQAIQQQSEEVMASGLFNVITDPAEQRNALEGLASLTGAMQSHWGATGGVLAKTLGEALTDVEKLPMLTMLGLDRDAVATAMRSGDMSSVLQTVSDRLQGMGGGELAQFTTQLQDITGLTELSAEEFGNLARNSEGMQATLASLNKLTVDAGSGIDALTSEVQKSKSGFQSWKDSLVSGIANFVGPNLMEFFEDVNPQFVISTAYMMKMGAEALVTGFKMVKGIGGGLKAGAQGMGILSKAAPVISTATTAVGGAAGVAGAGAAGAGIAGFLSGLGTGLAALGAGLLAGAPGLAIGGAILAGVAIAIAVALRIATPAIQAFGEIAMGIMDRVVLVFKEMATMDWKQLAMIAPVMLTMGPGMAAMGIGVAAMAGGMLLSIPALLAFAGVMKVFGNDTLSKAGGVFANVINNLALAFQIDHGALETALAGIKGAATFIVQFGKIAAVLTVAASMAVVGNLVGGIIKFFTGRSPLEQLVDSGSEMATTVNGLVRSMGGLHTTNLEPTAKKMAAVAGFMANFGKMAKALRISDPGALSTAVGKAIDMLAGGALRALIGKKPERIAKHAKGMRKTVDMLVKEYADWDTSGVGNMGENLGKVAEFTKAVGGMSEGVGKLDPGAMSALWDKMTWWHDKQDSIRKSAVGIKASVGFLLHTFGDMTVKYSKEKLGDIATMMTDAARIAVEGAKLGEALEELEDYDDLDTADIQSAANKIGAGIKAFHDANVGNLRANGEVAVLTKQELQTTVRVHVEGTVTASDSETHKLLRQLLAAMGGGGATPTERGIPRRPGADAAAVASGGGEGGQTF